MARKQVNRLRRVYLIMDIKGSLLSVALLHTLSQSVRMMWLALRSKLNDLGEIKHQARIEPEWCCWINQQDDGSSLSHETLIKGKLQDNIGYWSLAIHKLLAANIDTLNEWRRLLNGSNFAVKLIYNWQTNVSINRHLIIMSHSLVHLPIYLPVWPYDARLISLSYFLPKLKSRLFKELNWR